MSKERNKDLFGEYALNAATLGIYSVVGIWRDIQKQKAALRAQEDQQAATQPTKNPPEEKSQ
ncbi:MAG: hypothetical protein ISN26_06620 [Betaproteobacteria bacterium AqS2]|uniref:Uncharacterized protein n=1 Tax=Candidatus Amphirhobacter heronislandensis TaxID=1732024 RepID=A0A930XX43_9GAMM|nr:hypothetical protein [Betaproteobacteria bacterium AqS2]